jgi:hypothetical protein
MICVPSCVEDDSDADELAERAESRAELLGEEFRLLPRGEVAALTGLVEVDEVGVELLGPGRSAVVMMPSSGFLTFRWTGGKEMAVPAGLALTRRA